MTGCAAVLEDGRVVYHPDPPDPARLPPAAARLLGRTAAASAGTTAEQAAAAIGYAGDAAASDVYERLHQAWPEGYRGALNDGDPAGDDAYIGAGGLRTIMPSCYPERVDGYRAEIRNGADIGPSLVVAHGSGVHVLVDGTHHALARVLEGQKEIPVRILDLTKGRTAKAGFREDEARDDHGRWTKDGGGAARELADPGPPPGTEMMGNALWGSPQGVAQHITPAEETAAARVWYSDTAMGTNRGLRGGIPGGPYAADVATFAGLIHRSPAFTSWGLAYHGTDSTVFGEPGTAAGKTFTDRGFVSLSAKYDTAQQYGDAMVLAHLPPGVHALHADQHIWEMAGNPSYYTTDGIREYTLEPGSRFRVNRDEPADPGIGRLRTIDVTVLPPEPGPAAGQPRATAGRQGTPDGDRLDLSGLPGGDRFGWRPGDIEFDGGQGAQAAFRPDEARDDHGRWTTGGRAAKVAGLPPSGRFTMSGLPDDNPLWAKLDSRLATAQHKRGGGPVTRPALPPYKEAVARAAAEITRQVQAQGTIGEGRGWYPAEHALAERRAAAYKVPVDVAAAVEAATSPRVHWDINQRVTNEILDEIPKAGQPLADIIKTHRLGGGIMWNFRDDATAITLGGDIGKHLTGAKRRSFFSNIMWPGQTDQVTVDTWMLQSLVDGLGLTPAQAGVLAGEHPKEFPEGIGRMLTADATRQAAAGLTAQGIAMTPDATQAAYWLAAQKAAGIKPAALWAAAATETVAAGQKLSPGQLEDLDDDHWDAELLLDDLAWLTADIPGRIDLGPPGSARPQGGIAAGNPAAWAIAAADPRFAALGMTRDQAEQAARR